MNIVRYVLLCTAMSFATSACLSDQTDTRFDYGHMVPGLYCPDIPGLHMTHLRLVGLGTADVATLKPSINYNSEGRRVQRWVTSIVGGRFSVVVFPADGADEVHVAARAVCGPASPESADARGEVVRVTVWGKSLTVEAVDERH